MKIGPILVTVSETLASFARFVGDAGLRFPELVEYLFQGVLSIFKIKDELEDSGASPEKIKLRVEQERDLLASAAGEKFHGSGPQVNTQYVKALIEGIVAIVKVERYGPSKFVDRDEKARALGYLKSPDLDAAFKTMPWLFGVRP